MLHHYSPILLLKTLPKKSPYSLLRASEDTCSTPSWESSLTHPWPSRPILNKRWAACSDGVENFRLCTSNRDFCQAAFFSPPSSFLCNGCVQCGVDRSHLLCKESLSGFFISHLRWRQTCASQQNEKQRFVLWSRHFKKSTRSQLPTVKRTTACCVQRSFMALLSMPTSHHFMLTVICIISLTLPLVVLAILFRQVRMIVWEGW